MTETESERGEGGEATIRFTCPYCQAKYSAPVSAVGRANPCRECERTIAVPDPKSCRAAPDEPGVFYGVGHVPRDRIDYGEFMPPPKPKPKPPPAPEPVAEAAPPPPPKPAAPPPPPPTETLETATCPRCGGEIFAGSAWCNKCGKTLVEPEKIAKPKKGDSRFGARPERRSDDGVTTSRSVRGAFYTSMLFPGLGDLRKRDWVKGIVFLALGGGSVHLAVNVNENWWMVYAVVWLFGLFSAATVKGDEQLAGEVHAAAKATTSCMGAFWAILVVFGVVWGVIQLSRRADDALNRGAAGEFYQKHEAK